MPKLDYFHHYDQAVAQPLPEVREYFEKEDAYLKRLVHPDASILDVGCGTGRNLRVLAPLVKLAVGVDVNEKAVAACAERLASFTNVRLYQEDFFSVEFAATFDLVFATFNTLGGPLVHDFKRPAMLRKMLELTRASGHTVATFWRASAMEFSLRYFAHIHVQILDVDAKRHQIITPHGIFQRFTKDDIAALVRPLASRYAIIELTDVFYLLDLAL